MPLFGFFNDTQGNIIWLFMSPILFYISTQILKDHFQERYQKKEAEEKANAESKIKNIFEKSQPKDEESVNAGNTPVSLNFRNNVREKLMRYSDRSRENEEIANQLTEKQRLELEYSRIRYTVPYLVYQRVNMWKYIDKIALNFHLITAGVTLYLCVNWQVSVIMLVQFICAIGMTITLSQSLHRNSHKIKEENEKQWKK